MSSEGAGPSRAPAAKWSRVESGLDSLPPDVQERILELGWLPPTPLYDRGDVLRDAAALACVGNATCTELAQQLFAALSPRFGQELPNGVTDRSSAAALKAACKEWGLPVSGTKADLHQRLLNEVQDSEVTEEGEAPSHCLVSGATREELTGWSERRISVNKAKEVYNLWKHEVEACSFILDDTPPHGRHGVPAKMYSLQEVKVKARARHGSWEKIIGRRERDKEVMSAWREKHQAEQLKRSTDLKTELRKRGHNTTQVEAIMAGPGGGYVTWGSGEKLGPEAAASHLERMHFCVSDPDREEVFAMRFLTCGFQPPRTMSKYKVREHKLAMAANDLLRICVRDYASLQQLRDAPDVPASLLPEMERLWEEARQPGAAPPPGLLHMGMYLGIFDEEFEDFGDE